MAKQNNAIKTDGHTELHIMNQWGARILKRVYFGIKAVLVVAGRRPWKMYDLFIK